MEEDPKSVELPAYQSRFPFVDQDDAAFLVASDFRSHSSCIPFDFGRLISRDSDSPSSTRRKALGPLRIHDLLHLTQVILQDL